MKIYKKQVHILVIKYKTKEKCRICAKDIFLSRIKILAMGANYGKIYKEPNKSETETTINVLYSENMLSIYTNKVNLQKQLNKLLGAPTKEDKIKRSIAGSRWNISLDDKTKIQKIILKANIYEL